MMKRIFTLLMLITFSTVQARENLPRLLPRTLEIELAKSALPMYLQAEATVYVLQRGKGFVKAVDGSNGYTCFVERSTATPEAVIPIAFDAEGTRVMVPAMFDKMKMIEEGMSSAESQSVIDAGFKSGKYLPPAIGGISYMLSPLNILPRRRGGGTFNYYPHFMVYAPYASNQSIGVEKVDLQGYLPFVNATGPHGKIVIPLGEKERAEVERQHAGLIKRFKEYQKGLEGSN